MPIENLNGSPIRILAIHGKAVPISSAIHNAYVDSSAMTASVVAIEML